MPKTKAQQVDKEKQPKQDKPEKVKKPKTTKPSLKVVEKPKAGPPPRCATCGRYGCKRDHSDGPKAA